MELLIVIALIGVLMVVGVILLGTARERARDAKRLSDIDVIRRSLEEYYFNNNRYPQAPAPVVMGSNGYKVLCAGTQTGFSETRSACGGSTVYLDPIPVPPEPQPSQLTGYQYVSAAPFNTYSVSAALEGALNDLQGKIELTPAGLKQKP